MVKAMEVVADGAWRADFSLAGRKPAALKSGSEIQLMWIRSSSLWNRAQPLIASSTPQLKTTKWGTIVVDDEAETTMEGVPGREETYTSGGATVISAWVAGKIAAADMDGWLEEGCEWS